MDPYSILGVPKNCDRDTLRQKYKKLALASHPDRGGSEALFKMIKLSYQKISEELKLREIDKQFNELKMGFTDHKKSVEKPLKNRFMANSNQGVNNSVPQNPEHRDSSSEFIKRFNQVFEENRLDTPNDTGYAHFMDKSGSKREDINIEKTMDKFTVDNFNNKFNNIRSTNTKQIMKYKDPEPTSMMKSLDYVELGVEHIEDFSGQNERCAQSLRFMDYQSAHTTNRLIDPNQVNDRPQFNNVQQLEMDRSNTKFDMTDGEREAYAKRLKKAELQEQRRVEVMHRQDQRITDNFDKINQVMIGYRR